VKVAVITDDGQTISQHFGRARAFLVFSVTDGQVASSEWREKPGHHTFAPQDGDAHGSVGGHGMGEGSRTRHVQMLGVIADCQVLLAGGMGQGMQMALERAGIRPVLTAEPRIEAAIRLFLAGRLEERPDLAH